ncbi:hypothetical protein IPH25_02020 [bacterium]|nr:MAG: hypothetical protein IPG37_04150 [bacterium]QQR62201.1 MAG: hypothetical protein IPH25_02020 [bacterium]QQR63241.1 MAG: hypothetical protein IPH67_02080 [bacterium]
MESIMKNFRYYYEKYMFFIGAFGHTAGLFQAYTIFAKQTAAGVSLVGNLVAFVSIASWLFYGTLTKNTLLITINIFGLVCYAICLVLVLLYN